MKISHTTNHDILENCLFPTAATVQGVSFLLQPYFCVVCKVRSIIKWEELTWPAQRQELNNDNFKKN